MGKVKKRRTVSHKNLVPPTGGPSQAEIEDFMDVDEEMTSEVEKKAPDFLSGLTSLKGSVREATCVALASFFAGDGENSPDKQKMLQRLLNGGILKKLVPRMVDPSKLVRLHALGALRNISAFGGLDASDFMATVDIVAPSAKLVSEYATDEALHLPQTKDIHAVPILEQVFSLLTNLSESNSMTLTQVTHQREVFLPGMLCCLRVKQPGILLETMKLLLVLSDNNLELSQHLPAEYPSVLLDILQNSNNSIKLRLTTIGVAINLPNVLDNPTSVALLLPVLKTAIAYDSIGVVRQALATSDQWELSQEDYGTVQVISEEDVAEREYVTKVQNAGAAVRTWRENVQVLTLGLELLSNMLANVDSGADDEEWDSDDEEGMEQAAQNQGGNTYSRPVSELAQIFGAENLLEHVYRIVQSLVSTPPNVAAIVNDDFALIRERAITCLTNLIVYLSVPDLTKSFDLNQAVQVFLSVYANAQPSTSSEQIFDTTRENSTDIPAAVMAALGAVVLRSVDDNLPLNLSNEQLNVVVQCATSSTSVEARTNAVRLLGTLGKKQHTLEENKVLGMCLGQTLNDTDLQVICEVLNALFDIYADEQYDQVFFELNFLTPLEHVSAGMKSKIKNDAKQLGRELTAHAKETRLNLLRFIKYKKQHRR